MSAEPLLNAMDDLFGVSPVGGASAGAAVRALSNPAVPPSWRSPAAVGLDDRQGDVDSARNVLAQRDDVTKAQLDAAGAAVRDGKAGMAQIKTDYRLNRDRLAGAPSPEMQAKLDELDRARVQDGVNTVRSAQARLPNLGGAQSGMGAPFQALPQALSGAAPQMLGAPLQAITPLTSALSGITIPQQIPHTLASPGAGWGHPTGLGGSDAEYLGKGPAAIRAAIDKALDIKGITDPVARANWGAGMTTLTNRESGGNVDAQNNTDSNAAKGTPSQGAFQFIEPTFRAYHEPGTSSYLRDPVAQACAFINYAQGHYGVSADGHDLAAKIQQADPTRSPRGY
jgi:hypothetical protein